VTLVSRTKKNLEEAVATLPEPEKHDFAVCDLSDSASVKVLGDQLQASGDTHILVNNSGGPSPCLPTDVKIDDMEAAFKSHLYAGMTLTNAVIGGMKRLGYGRIINVTSVAARQPVGNLPISNTVRCAIAGWSKTLALEVAKDGITVNCVLPGYTATDRLKELFGAASKKLGISEEEVAGKVISEIPMGRFAEPEEFGAVVAFLASPAASYLTGVSIPVCGGWLKSVF
jgi:3-oxoacyl-[acyl-carrier protein] reductase